MRRSLFQLLTISAAALCVPATPAHLSAQLTQSVGVSALAGTSTAQIGGAPSHRAYLSNTSDSLIARLAFFPAEPDTGSQPLIRMPPGWWPNRVTHQNVAALILMGAVGFGVLWVLPEDISEWDKSIPISVYLKRAYSTPPVWDHDQLYWNYVVHPITGSWVYLMERNHDRPPIRGFLLSTAASIGWEYGFEAMIEHPSIQDLIITSTVGSLLGELSHKATLKMKENGFNGLERVALTIINPAYAVWKGYR